MNHDTTAPGGPMRRRHWLKAGMALTGASLLGLAGCARTPRAPTRQHTIRSTARDGVALFVTETGNPDGRPILFIHGYSQSHESWERQWQAPALTRDFRLIAVDLRGHGASGKPLDKAAYHDGQRWADDMQSVITQTSAQGACVVAWSYGGRVLNDYLTHFGEQDLGALNYVAASSTSARFGLGRDYALIMPTLSDDPATEQAGTLAFLRACFARTPSEAALREMLRYNSQTPVAVRKLLGGRPADYEATLDKIRIPTLITHGLEDRISAPAMSEYTASRIRHARFSRYAGIGHSPFYEDPDRFNAELAALARSAA